MKTRLALLALLALTLGVAAQAQTSPVDIEFGYRWTDIKGNQDMYRTQINERDGFIVRNLSFFTSGQGFDHFRVDAVDLGAGPWGALNLEVGKKDSYKFRLGYRQVDAYSALPGYANPYFSQGITPGQHTFDRTRTFVDADLEILPGHKITPFVGFSWGKNEGPGSTTFTVGGDDFLLSQDLNEKDQEIRAGLGFNTGMFTGQITQGWRSFSADESLTLAPGAGAGNNPGSVLGRPISSTGITRNRKDDIDTPFTNAFVTAQVLPKLRLIGNYTRFAAELDGSETEADAGSFVSFGLSRFFAALDESVTGKAKNDTWRGGAKAEFDVTDKVSLMAGYQKDHRELEGSSLISSLYRNAVTFTGLDARDIQDILNTENGLKRDETILNASVSARAVGPFALRAGYTQTKQDLDVMPDLEEIVVPGLGQGGQFERKINTFDASATMGKAGFTLGAAYRRDKADEAVVRTDFINRDRLRLRAAYAFRKDFVRVGVTAEQIDQDNDASGIGYDGTSRQYSGDIEVNPFQILRLRASASKFKADSTILFRRPETFDIETSMHEEDGDALEGGFTLNLPKTTIDAGVARFENEGSFPFSMDRYRARVTFDIFAKAGIAAEWSRDNYEETPSMLGEYEATRYGLYLRLHP